MHRVFFSTGIPYGSLVKTISFHQDLSSFDLLACDCSWFTHFKTVFQHEISYLNFLRGEDIILLPCCHFSSQC